LYRDVKVTNRRFDAWHSVGMFAKSRLQIEDLSVQICQSGCQISALATHCFCSKVAPLYGVRRDIDRLYILSIQILDSYWKNVSPLIFLTDKSLTFLWNVSSYTDKSSKISHLTDKSGLTNLRFVSPDLSVRDVRDLSNPKFVQGSYTL